MRKLFRMKTLMFAAALCIIIAIAVRFFWIYYHNRDVLFRASGSGFQIMTDGNWRDFTIKGVNIGAGKPGAFPGEMAITKEEYARWIKQIAEMNANTIRIYTILSPAFYEALYEYNMTTDKPLYLFQGAWINEEDTARLQNAYDPVIADEFTSEIERVIDLLHGKAEIEERVGHAYGKYRWDVSPYVIGYIFGIELDTPFVTGTNEKNASLADFNGEYLYTEDASPHEAWLAKIGDHAISYEMNSYGSQKPVSWVNWLTTDPLWHSNEPDAADEDAVSVDTEHIKAKNSFAAGLFASYHVYPYYPEFMNYQPEYVSYKDESGKQNPYKAYLLDLRAHHTVPVLVAEFGLPTSRGICHENAVMGYNQGGMTERQQGEYLAKMYDDIVSSDMAGGLIFTWQDEWFKRSWNNMDYDLPERRSYWSNAQTAEQAFGLMTFDPGEKRALSQTDGDLSEWKSPLISGSEEAFYIMSDARYIYMMVKGSGRYVIGIDSAEGQGNSTFADKNVGFRRQIDSVVVIDGKENSYVMNDAYYDVFYRMYSLSGIIPRDERFEKKNSGIFNPIRLMLSSALTLPLTGEIIPTRYYDTGKLLHGNSNPESADYYTFADFYISSDNDAVELRIPWQLLNIADPSSKMAVGDMYAVDGFGLNPAEIEGIFIELHALDKDESFVGEGFYSWDSWDEVAYHERLKESYYIIKDTFAAY